MNVIALFITEQGSPSHGCLLFFRYVISQVLLFQEHICSFRRSSVFLLRFISIDFQVLVSASNLISCYSKFLMGELSYCGPCVLTMKTCNILLNMQYDMKLPSDAAKASREEEGKLKWEHIHQWIVVRWCPWPLSCDQTRLHRLLSRLFHFQPTDTPSFICRPGWGIQQWDLALPMQFLLYRML